MYNESDKKQVRYSLEQLSKGLFYHLRYRSFNDISVTDICRRANISRRTFYRNCECKEDLVIYSTDRLVSELIEGSDLLETDPRRLYEGFFNYWREHRQFLGSIYRNSLFDMFLKEFVRICNVSLRYPLQERAVMSARNNELIRRYSNVFMIGGLGLMLKEWAAEDFTSSVEEIAGSILFLVPSF